MDFRYYTFVVLSVTISFGYYVGRQSRRNYNHFRWINSVLNLCVSRTTPVYHGGFKYSPSEEQVRGHLRQGEGAARGIFPRS